MDDAIDLTLEQIATGLRAWARGLYPLEAAVELLIAHDIFLRRTDFRRSALWISADGPEFIGVDWTAAHDLANRAPASRSEISALNVATSLAGHHLAPSLGDLLTAVDMSNVAMVLHAIAHTAGWHERGTAALITGEFPDRNGRVRGRNSASSATTTVCRRPPTSLGRAEPPWPVTESGRAPGPP